MGLVTPVWVLRSRKPVLDRVLGAPSPKVAFTKFGEPWFTSFL